MKLQKILLILGVVLLFSLNLKTESFSASQDFKVIMSTNVLEEESKYLDINSATEEEMLNSGITLRQVGMIVDYREKTGGFENINELKRIKGIGQATFEKLRKKLIVKMKPKKKPLYINKASDETLKYYGFEKNDIKNIRKFIRENGKINSNLDLMKILSKKDYDKYKKIIIYDKF